MGVRLAAVLREREVVAVLVLEQHGGAELADRGAIGGLASASARVGCSSWRPLRKTMSASASAAAWLGDGSNVWRWCPRERGRRSRCRPAATLATMLVIGATSSRFATAGPRWVRADRATRPRPADSSSPPHAATPHSAPTTRQQRRQPTVAHRVSITVRRRPSWHRVGVAERRGQRVFGMGLRSVHERAGMGCRCGRVRLDRDR